MSCISRTLDPVYESAWFAQLTQCPLGVDPKKGLSSKKDDDKQSITDKFVDFIKSAVEKPSSDDKRVLSDVAIHRKRALNAILQAVIISVASIALQVLLRVPAVNLLGTITIFGGIVWGILGGVRLWSLQTSADDVRELISCCSQPSTKKTSK